MNLLENIKLALEGLRANKMRALLTMLGIIIGIASVIAITSLGDAMSNTLNETLSNVGGRNIQLYVMPKDVDGTYSNSDEDNITDEMIERFRQRYGDEIEGLEISNNVGAAKTVDVIPQQEMKITGANHDYFTVENVKIVQGRAISDRDVEGEKNVIVISSIMQKNLYGEGSDPIGKEIKVETTYGTESFYVVGVYQDPMEDATQSAMMVAMGVDFDLMELASALSPVNLIIAVAVVLGAILGSALVGYLVGFYPIDSAVTAGLCMANRGGSGDIAVLGAADRLDLIAYAQLSSRIGGGIVLVVASVVFSVAL